jgi:hypothetical protein
VAARLEASRYAALDRVQGARREPREQPEPERERNRDQSDGREQHGHVVADQQALGELLDGEHGEDRGRVGQRARSRRATPRPRATRDAALDRGRHG